MSTLNDAFAADTTVGSSSENESGPCNGTGTHDDIVMESGGVINEDCPNYVEEDDVKDSIAEGYF